MNNRKLTWRHLKALNELYETRRTDAKITDNNYIKNVLIRQRGLIRYKSSNTKILEATSLYPAFYKKNFLNEYTVFNNFLKENELENDARRRYTEDDIQTLMFIAEQKLELLKNLTTLKTFSNNIFKGFGSKYLENKSGLKDAVCKVLGIVDFPEKDPKNFQWRFVIDCQNPKIVVLCENLDNLKKPWVARENNIELWYVGGNNIGIIDHIDKEKLSKPLYYSCDWDYHGLSIYSRIHTKLQKIKILIPYTFDIALPVGSPHHYSKWNNDKFLSGLDKSLFSGKAVDLIQRLIKENKWIEEESLDLLKLLNEV